MIVFYFVLIVLFFSTSLAFADDGKPIHVTILDSYSQVSLESNLTIDSVKQKKIISAIQDSFDFQYDDLESLISISYDGNLFAEKSSSIAFSSNCQTEIISTHIFNVDYTDIDSIFLEIIAHDIFSKSSLSQTLIFQSDDPENWIITAVTEKKETKVQMLHCEERLTEFISSSDQDEIISRLVKVTGLLQSQILDIWSYENKDLIEKKEFEGLTSQEIITKGEQIMIDAAENQAKMEQTLETIQTGEGELDIGEGGCLIATATYGNSLEKLEITL